MNKAAFPIICILVTLAGILVIVQAANQDPNRDVPAWLEGPHRIIHATPFVRDLAKQLRAGLVRTTATERAAPPDAVTRAVATAADPAPLDREAPGTDSAEITVASLPRPSEPADGVATAQVSPTPPEQPASEGSWAIVAAHDATLYDVAGKNRGQVKVGSLAIVKRRAKSGTREMLVCQGKDSKTPFILARDEVLILPGQPDTASPEHRSLLNTLATLTADRKEREKDVRNGVRKDNPHAVQFAAAKRRYVQYWKKVKRLQSERESAKGDTRIAVAEELRKLKGQDVKIGQDYESAKQRYEAWSAAHPAPAKARDAELERLDKAIASLREKIDALGHE
jgi:hypothetical protein